MNSYQPPAPDYEPHKILIKREDFVDSDRGGRIVPVKIYYPVSHELDSLPVIVWSHGLGGSREGAGFLARYIASHGYVVVNVQHAGTDSGMWEGKPGHPWDVIRATPITRETVVNRLQDIPFVLDRLPEWMHRNPDVSGYMDISHIGMSGHSFGALTTQIMIGQGYTDQNGKIAEMLEPRIKAGIAYSPVPGFQNAPVDPAALYRTIARPLLHITGTKDESPVEGFSYEERLAVFEHAGAGDQYLVILEDGDHMVYAGSRGKLDENPKRATHEDVLKVLSLVFWNAFLKEDNAARSWLDHGLENYLGSEAAIKHRALGLF